MRNANKTNGKHSRIEAKSFGRVEDNINAIPIMKDAGGKKCSLQPSPPSLVTEIQFACHTALFRVLESLSPTNFKPCGIGHLIRYSTPKIRGRSSPNEIGTWVENLPETWQSVRLFPEDVVVSQSSFCSSFFILSYLS